MTALESNLRKQLERAVVRARDIAEDGARATLQTLAVSQTDAYATMGQEQRDLRTALRAKAKNLGEGSREAGIAPLVEEIAYEQWHRLLFARFLAENRLLMHPLGGHLSIEECAELAPSEEADNGWDLAGRYAARMLPGIFRADDPAAQIHLAREYRTQLEGLVAGLPEDVFTSDDGLGWTYQFWQAKRKDEVNRAGHKIGARELAPVTQLFTEDYMVRFLLENSLGAWWAARHPQSPLLKEMAYLRFAEDGTPAAGSFPGWPERAAEVTVMDPCCGSGHFLVRAFHLLRQMRMEEEGLDPAAAGDAVLRDNLFGLELDERCVQIASFALAMEAWKSGGYRAIPAPQVACSGVPVGGQLEEWLRLAGNDVDLRQTLEELHRLFRDAPSLGSLINPHQVVKGQGMFAPDWKDVENALLRIDSANENRAIVAATVGEAARAASLLGRTYVLAATNPPFLNRGNQAEYLNRHLESQHSDSKADLATVFIDRCLDLSATGGSIAMVSPQNWLSLQQYGHFRRRMLESTAIGVVARLGSGAFDTISGEVVKVALFVVSNSSHLSPMQFSGLNASSGRSGSEKAEQLRNVIIERATQVEQLRNPDARVVIGALGSGSLLRSFASSSQGICTGDINRFTRKIWELPANVGGWRYFMEPSSDKASHAGRSQLLYWQNGNGQFRQFLVERLGEKGIGAWLRGQDAWGKNGIAVSQTGSLQAGLYHGELFEANVAVIVPEESRLLAPMWHFCRSAEFVDSVRMLDQGLWVTCQTLLKVPFDVERWQNIADEMGPLPEPHSDDPTQWLFKGQPKGSDAPLQVAVARLLGYRWPEQPEDGLEGLADADGIVPLSSVRGETPAAERLRALLAAAYGEEWSHGVQERLLAEVGFAGRDLGAWLADGKGFFAQHVKLFHNRPFIWQIVDGARDGFSVLVNYHKLTLAALEKLIYTYLGDWIARQEQARNAGDPTAETRLLKARELKAKLEAIRDGNPPYDVYVRWKPLHQQPIGWDPDLNDGVRLNIRPFVEAGILRSKFSINWNKDRGDNPPGSTARQYAAEAQQAAQNRGELSSTDGRERLNDLHLTRQVKEAARQRARGEAAS